MTAVEIYNAYNINKGLCEHMLRVAAVAQLICEHSNEAVDTKSVVTACLLHDLGNLVKAVEMEKNHMLYEPEGVAYWSEQKAALIARYGTDPDVVTQVRLEEIGISDATQVVYEAIGNQPTKRVSETGTLEEQIANYCDMRVGLQGVISLDERMADIRHRYKERGLESIAARASYLQKIEARIFEQCSLQPADLTDTSTATVQTALLDWEITTK